MSAPQPELLACPFCGKSAATVWNSAAGCWSVECYDEDDGCGAEVMRPTEAEAITAWNTRATDPKAQALADALRGFIASVEIGDLYSPLCCGGGAECSCRGSTNADLLIHDSRAALAAWDAKP